MTLVWNSISVLAMTRDPSKAQILKKKQKRKTVRQKFGSAGSIHILRAAFVFAQSRFEKRLIKSVANIGKLTVSMWSRYAYHFRSYRWTLSNLAMDGCADLRLRIVTEMVKWSVNTDYPFAIQTAALFWSVLFIVTYWLTDCITVFNCRSFISNEIVPCRIMHELVNKRDPGRGWNQTLQVLLRQNSQGFAPEGLLSQT